MQSRITRIIAAIMALVMVVCCFSACKGKDAEEETTTPSIEWPTNPNDEDTFVNDGSNIDPNAPEQLTNSQLGTNNNSNGGSNINIGGSTGTIGGSTGTIGGSTSGSTGTTSGSSSGSNSILDPNYWEKEIKHFFTHFDTAEERISVLQTFGYEYDAAQDIYYTSKDPWQRQMGFTDIYDQGAKYTSMYYLTLKADFEYDDTLWRLQWWKGQYGVLEGAELGVYTKDSFNASAPFYRCADSDHELKMAMDYYHTLADYRNNNRLFTRTEQEHWWLTGFKFGVVGPKRNVVRATLYAENDTMADAIEAAIQNLTDGNNKLTGKGFVPYESGKTETDFYIRNGNRFSIVWYQAGYLNYVPAVEVTPSGSEEATTEAVAAE